jgi:T-complex protein 1 subunit alpha
MKLIEQQRIHPTSIILGYKKALRGALDYIKKYLTIPVNKLGDECLMNIARTSLSSKLVSAYALSFILVAFDFIFFVCSLLSF